MNNKIVSVTKARVTGWCVPSNNSSTNKKQKRQLSKRIRTYANGRGNIESNGIIN